MKPLFQKLLVTAPIVIDGGWNTELQALGLERGQCPDLWNIAKADSVESVGRSYVNAGSKIILTNTFRSNRLALEPYSLVEKMEMLNRSGVEISRRAAQKKALVFGS